MERAFEHEFIPDSFELINVYKLYDVDIQDADEDDILPESRRLSEA